MSATLWSRCLEKLESELSEQQLNTWIRPLQARVENGTLRLLAPNEYVLDWVKNNLHERISQVLLQLQDKEAKEVELEVGSHAQQYVSPTMPQSTLMEQNIAAGLPKISSNLNTNFTFDNYVEGKSNQLARAASIQVAENLGLAYNPLFIYGGVGLGKTHLMHAIGNAMLEKKPDARIVYLHSEKFVGDMVRALQHNAINEFKRLYRSVDGLLIDDIQFFAGKERSQEEFFHTFNALLEGQQQVILTCDRFPKEIDGLEERLKSRFGWGFTTTWRIPTAMIPC